MPAILPREAWPTWLGETGASLADAKAVLQTFEDVRNWTMMEQDPTRPSRPRKPAKPKPQQELF